MVSTYTHTHIHSRSSSRSIIAEHIIRFSTTIIYTIENNVIYNRWIDRPCDCGRGAFSSLEFYP